MKSAKALASLTKIARILSKIIFICAIVGTSICLCALLSLLLGIGTLRLHGISLHSLIQQNAGVSAGSLYAAGAVGALLCTGAGVLAKFAELTFLHALANKTPFCRKTAKELMRLGILTIAIPLGTQTICAGVHSLFSLRFSEVAPLSLSCDSSVTLGVMLLILSLVCFVGTQQLPADIRSDPTEPQA